MQHIIPFKTLLIPTSFKTNPYHNYKEDKSSYNQQNECMSLSIVATLTIVVYIFLFVIQSCMFNSSFQKYDIYIWQAGGQDLVHLINIEMK